MEGLGLVVELRFQLRYRLFFLTSCHASCSQRRKAQKSASRSSAENPFVRGGGLTQHAAPAAPAVTHTHYPRLAPPLPRAAPAPARAPHPLHDPFAIRAAATAAARCAGLRGPRPRRWLRNVAVGDPVRRRAARTPRAPCCGWELRSLSTEPAATPPLAFKPNHILHLDLIYTRIISN